MRLLSHLMTGPGWKGAGRGVNYCGTWDSIGRRERKLAGFKEYVAIPRGSSIHRNNYSTLSPPNPHLATQQCHQCDLRPLFNQYDCLSLCVHRAAPCYTFFSPLGHCVCSQWGEGLVNMGEWAMYRWYCNFGLKLAWCRRVCCILAKAFVSRQGQQHACVAG